MDVRQCWNRQTGTFEGRVSLTYGFKSRLPHQEPGGIQEDTPWFLFWAAGFANASGKAMGISYFVKR